MKEIRDRYYSVLETRGVHLSFHHIETCLTSFREALKSIRDQLGEIKPVEAHPNILLVLTSGLSYADVEESIRRYIPHGDIWPSEGMYLVPSFEESDLSDSYVRPSSPGYVDWSVLQDRSIGMSLDGNKEDGDVPSSHHYHHHHHDDGFDEGYEGYEEEYDDDDDDDNNDLYSPKRPSSARSSSRSPHPIRQHQDPIRSRSGRYVRLLLLLLLLYFILCYD